MSWEFLFISINIDKIDVNYKQLKKSMKINISADKIYYNLSQENSKITNMLLHIPDRQFNKAVSNTTTHLEIK